METVKKRSANVHAKRAAAEREQHEKKRNDEERRELQDRALKHREAAARALKDAQYEASDRERIAAGYTDAAAQAEAAADALGGEMEDAELAEYDPYEDPATLAVLQTTAEPLLLGTKRVRRDGATVMVLPEWQGEENDDNHAAGGRAKRSGAGKRRADDDFEDTRDEADAHVQKGGKAKTAWAVEYERVLKAKDTDKAVEMLGERADQLMNEPHKDAFINFLEDVCPSNNQLGRSNVVKRLFKLFTRLGEPGFDENFSSDKTGAGAENPQSNKHWRATCVKLKDAFERHDGELGDAVPHTVLILGPSQNTQRNEEFRFQCDLGAGRKLSVGPLARANDVFESVAHLHKILAASRFRGSRKAYFIVGLGTQPHAENYAWVITVQGV